MSLQARLAGSPWRRTSELVQVPRCGEKTVVQRPPWGRAGASSSPGPRLIRVIQDTATPGRNHRCLIFCVKARAQRFPRTFALSLGLHTTSHQGLGLSPPSSDSSPPDFLSGRTGALIPHGQCSVCPRLVRPLPRLSPLLPPESASPPPGNLPESWLRCGIGLKLTSPSSC